MSLPQESPPIPQTRLDPLVIRSPRPHFLLIALIPRCNVHLSFPPPHPQTPPVLWGHGQVCLFTAARAPSPGPAHRRHSRTLGVTWTNRGGRKDKQNWEGTVQGPCCPFSCCFGRSGLHCQIQRAWLCRKADIPLPMPGRGSRCFPKTHVVIVPAA